MRGNTNDGRCALHNRFLNDYRQREAPVWDRDVPTAPSAPPLHPPPTHAVVPDGRDGCFHGHYVYP